MIPDEHPAADHPAGLQASAERRGVWIALGELGAIAVADLLCEGAAADWAAVYLRTSLGAPPAVAALGYTAYSLARAAVRLARNHPLVRFAPRRLLPCSAC